MDKFINLKELKENIKIYVEHIKKGESLTVMRQSTPLFKISPFEEKWEEVIDFTKIKRGGVNMKEILFRI